MTLYQPDLSRLALRRRGPSSDLYAGSDPGTVVKVYHDKPTRSGREAAEVEFARLARLHPVLERVDRVACPRPIAHGEASGSWYLVMEEVRGASLLDLRSGERQEPAEVATLLARGLEAYGGEFEAPHYGLKPQDVLVDPASRSIVLLDFEPSHAERQLWRIDLPPAVVSAGILLGRTLHLAAAPHMLVRRALAGWLTNVAAETARLARAREAPAFEEVVRASYERQRTRRARWWRMLWYGWRWRGIASGALRRATAPG